MVASLIVWVFRASGACVNAVMFLSELFLYDLWNYYIKFPRVIKNQSERNARIKRAARKYPVNIVKRTLSTRSPSQKVQNLYIYRRSSDLPLTLSLSIYIPSNSRTNERTAAAAAEHETERKRWNSALRKQTKKRKAKGCRRRVAYRAMGQGCVPTACIARDTNYI